MRCGHCGYRLRGLADERCSECGRIVDPSKTLADDPPPFPKRAIIIVWIIVPLIAVYIAFTIEVESIIPRSIIGAVGGLIFAAFTSVVLILDWRFMARKRRD